MAENQEDQIMKKVEVEDTKKTRKPKHEMDAEVEKGEAKRSADNNCSSKTQLAKEC